MANGEAPSYIARDAHGCLVAASVDNPEHAKENAKEIARWIRDGRTVERTTVGYVRSAKWGHQPGCPKYRPRPQEQPEQSVLGL